MDILSYKEIELKANSIRESIMQMLLTAGTGHSAGPLGLADVFAVLYFRILKIFPTDPWSMDRDFLFLSNGHVCPVLYSTLAEADFFDKSELPTLRRMSTRLQGHPHLKSLPGVENTGGPLGQGISQAVGMALGLRMQNRRNRVVCVTGDGEHNEGQVWEAIMLAAKYKLSRLCVVVDRNNIQIDGFTEDVMPLNDLKAKYEAFGFHVIEVDGHNVQALSEAFGEADSVYERPTCVIARTVPGKGVNFMERDYHWHGIPPNSDQAREALKDLRTLRGRMLSEHE